MTHTTFLRRPSPRTLVLVLWTLFALAAGLERVTGGLLLARADDIARLRQDLWLLAIWAAATPAIFWSVRRYPVRGAQAVRHATMHLAAATAFIVASNVLIRLPFVPSPAQDGATWLMRSTLLGLGRFYPVALLAYGVVVALARLAWTEETGETEALEVPLPNFAPEDVSVPAAERPERVVVREWNRVHLVRPDDITWITADDNYVVVHAAGRSYKGRGRISELEAQLDPAVFVRIHRSVIVHVAAIREVQPLSKGDLALVLHDGKVLRVARGRRAALEAALNVPL